MKSLTRILVIALEIAATALGLYLLYGVFKKYDTGDIAGAIGKLPTPNVLWALLLTLGSYACVFAIEYMAMLYATDATKGLRLKTRGACSVPRIMATAVAALGIGRTLGLAVLSGGAIRYRMYSRAHVTPETVAKLLLFAGMTAAAGLLTTGSGAMLWHSGLIARYIDIPPYTVRIIGAILGAAVLIYLVACAFIRSDVRIRRVTIALPPLRLAFAQVIFSSVNLALIAGALYACLAPFTDWDYTRIAALYVGSETTSSVAHVPGGWGVLEYTMTRFIKGSNIIAGVLVFRAIYHLMMMGIGLAIFITDELAGGVRSAMKAS
jgi:glycosyltransferase 2 family protein